MELVDAMFRKANQERKQMTKWPQLDVVCRITGQENSSYQNLNYLGPWIIEVRTWMGRSQCWGLKKETGVTLMEGNGQGKGLGHWWGRGVIRLYI